MKQWIVTALTAAVISIAVGFGVHALLPAFSPPPETEVLSGEGAEEETAAETKEAPAEKENTTGVEEASVSATQENLSISDPEELSVPSIDVSASLEPVGVLDNGQMGVPSTENGVAWFEPGPEPGEKGNAVMAGHVDSIDGPSVFYELETVQAGEKVGVTTEGGQELVFEVQRVVSYPREEAPIEEIFGGSDSRNLNLITCAGTFEQEHGTHDERLVVYTELTEESEQTLLEAD
ncbi:LPXTG-site transpeptidase (sortase) family protein [Marinococcus luteus]|uniref:LPXTG-site transpeptidase (Sortase) family protein n=1 Tax=Marinococcus luteus TaxID=1122204 RepID=A0A1H2UDH1_9BACI|nr:class F sortase [Marinococcus luteus]SDW54067.1 LPXTG-site transpeptidase (sortase) family protein [Marinococcus luteus]